MRVTSILRTGMLALALGASITSIAPAIAGTVDQSSQAEQQQHGNTGVYDGAAWNAAKNAANSGG
jgi:hypothetical protein